MAKKTEPAKKKAKTKAPAQQQILIEAGHTTRDLKRVQIDLSEIEETQFSESDIRGLADTIKRVGLLEAPVLWGTEPPYHISAGKRRIAALRFLKETKVHVMLRAKDTVVVAAGITLTENAVRKDNPLAELGAIETLLESGMDEAGICKSLNWSKGRLYSRLKLRKLVPIMREALSRGRMTYSTARNVAALNTAEQNEVVEEFKRRLGEANNKAGVKVTGDMVTTVKATKPVQLDSLFNTEVALSTVSHDVQIGRLAHDLETIAEQHGDVDGVAERAVMILEQMRELAGMLAPKTWEDADESTGS